MAQYAKDQPAGYVNYISKVAIIGAGGNVGKHMTQALLQTGKHTVTALTRIGSKSVLPDGVITAPVDYANEDSLVAALKGQQFLIVSLAVTAGAAAEAVVMSAAAKAGVPWVMPTCYGTDIENGPLNGGEPDRPARLRQHCLRWTRRWRGGATARCSSRASWPSQRDMLDSVHRVPGHDGRGTGRWARWTAQARYDAGRRLLGGPEGHRGFSHCLYTRTLFRDGGGDFGGKVANEALGLPEEDMDEATRRAVDMALMAGDFEYAKGAH